MNLSVYNLLDELRQYNYEKGHRTCTKYALYIDIMTYNQP